MKTKRIISMLLSTALALSTLPLTASATGDGTPEAQPADDVIVLDDGWSVNSGAVEFITDTNGDGAKNADGNNVYTHVDNATPGNDMVSGGAYTDTVTLPAGKTYKFTVWLRSTPTYKNNSMSENNFNLALGYAYAQNNLFKKGTNNNIEVLAVSTDGVDNTTGRITLYDTWTKYTSVFTTLAEVPFRVQNVLHGGIIFYPLNASDGDGSPFDIDGLSLYESQLSVDGYTPVNGAENIVGGSVTEHWSTHPQWTSNGAKLTQISESPFYRASAGTSNTVVEYSPVTDTVLSDGIYELSADFRLGDLIWEEWMNSPTGGNEATLTASVGSASVTSEAPVSVTNDWTNAKFTVEVNGDNVKLSDVKFALDEARALDINNVKLVKTVSYVDDYTYDNGDKVSFVKEDALFESYLRGSTPTNEPFCFGYKSDKLVSTFGDSAIGSTYKLSMWLRVAPGTAPNSNYSEYAILNFGGPYSSQCTLSKLGLDGEFQAVDVRSLSQTTDKSTYLQITSEWKEYTIVFDVKKNISAFTSNFSLAAYGIRFSFLGGNVNSAFAPVDIAGMSLVKLDADGNAVDGSELIGDSGTWYSDNVVVKQGKIEEITEAAEYYRADAVSGTNTVVKSGSDEILPIGVYTVKGNFRTDKAAKLTISVGSETSEAIDVSNEWSSGELTIKVKAPIPYSAIKFALDASCTFDFANITFTKIMDYDDSYTNLDDEPVIKISEDYPFESYIHTYSNDDNPNPQFSVYFGFGYRGDALTAEISKGEGTYELSFYARSATVATDKLVLTLGTEFSSEFVLTKLDGASGDDALGYITVNSIEGGAYANNKLSLSTEWQKYTINFTLSGGVRNIAERGIRFHNMTNPTDIAGLTLNRVDSGNEAAIIDGNDGGEWYTDTSYIDSADLNTVYTEYYRAENATGIKSGSDEIIPLGIYTVKGNFKADKNTDITVKSGNEASETVDISTAWTSAEFTVKVKETLAYSDIAFALGSACTLDFANITFTKVMDYDDSYTNLDDEPVIKISEDYPFESYIHTYSNDDNPNPQFSVYFGFGYRGNALTAEISKGEGTYELSFYARSATEATDKLILTIGTEFSTEYFLTHLGTTNTVTVNSIDGGAYESGINNGNPYGRLLLSTEWQKYTINFTLSGGVPNIAERGIRFHNMANPTDIAGLTLTRVDAGNEAIIIDGNDNGEWYTDTIYIDSAAIVELLTNYYRAENVNGIKSTSGDLMAMGIYTVTGNFRADKDTVISAYANGEGNEGAEVSTEWQELTLTVRLKEATKRSDIEFRLGDECTLDFANIKYAKELDYIDSFIGANGDPVAEVNEDNPFAEYTYFCRNADDNAFDFYGFGYTSNALTQAVSTGNGGTFELSFYARSATDALDRFSMTLGTEFSSEYYLTKLGTNDTITVNSIDGPMAAGGGIGHLQLSTEWQKFTINFTLAGGVPNISTRGIRFHFLKNPMEIGGLTLIRTDSNEVIIDENDAGTWYTDNRYIDTAAISNVLSHYYRAEGVDGKDTGIKIVSSDALEAGVYYITGDFRIGESGGTANLSAYIGEAQLATLSGAKTVKLSDKWARVTFVAKLAVDSFTLGDILFILDSDLGLDFANVSYEQIDRYLSFSSVNIGTIMTLLALKKAYAEGRGPVKEDDGKRVEIELSKMPLAQKGANLVSGLFSKKNWIYGDQTIDIKKDEDGNNYISFGNITNNRTGFTYKPNIALRSGAYRFTAELRTENPDETTVVRLLVGGKRASLKLTNEWTKVEFLFEPKERTSLEFTVKGGPVNWFVQDYEMRNITFTDLSGSPIDIEITQNADFENAEIGLANWSVASGAGNIELVTEDGNTFLRNTERTINYQGIYYNLPEKIDEGAVYTVSYDIRTSVPGETMIARAHYYEGLNTFNTDLILNDGASNAGGEQYEVTNEWKHIECTLITTKSGALRIGIAGGPYEHYIQAFDIDNFKVIRKFGLRTNVYEDGNFENPETALKNWAGMSGAGTIELVTEDGNSFLRNSGRTLNYHDIILTTPINMKAGQTVTISYDVRTAVEGETSRLRANGRINNGAVTDLKITSAATNNYGNEYAVTNEWRHIECSYTASEDGRFKFAICGAGYVEYIQAFDLDNLVIEIVE